MSANRLEKYFKRRSAQRQEPALPKKKLLLERCLWALVGSDLTLAVCIWGLQWIPRDQALLLLVPLMFITVLAAALCDDGSSP